MDGNTLENIYQENLEENGKSMEIYYRSKLSKKIEEGKLGIQYLDYKVLVDILRETEQELFE